MNDINKMIESYKESSIAHCKASKEGDYKTANKNYSKLTKFFKQFKGDEVFRSKALEILLKDSNYSVQLWAASHSLGLGFETKKAEEILRFISELSSNLAPSFEAKMTLDVWEKKGELTF